MPDDEPAAPSARRPWRPVRDLAMPRRLPAVLGAVVAAAGLAGAVLTLAGVRSPVTGPLTLLFLLFAPAASVAALLPGLDPLARAVVSGGAAIVLPAAVAEVMLAAAAWSPRGGVLAVGAVCAILLAAALPRLRSGPADDPEEGSDDEWLFTA